MARANVAKLVWVQIVIVDEIGSEAEALACRTIAERGVQLIGTAHGQLLENLLKNPTLSDLVGGVQSVTLGLLWPAPPPPQLLPSGGRNPVGSGGGRPLSDPECVFTGKSPPLQLLDGRHPLRCCRRSPVYHLDNTTLCFNSFSQSHNVCPDREGGGPREGGGGERTIDTKYRM